MELTQNLKKSSFLYLLMVGFIFLTVRCVSAENSHPVADAGEDQIVSFFENVILDGSKSYDLNGDRISYSWSCTPGVMAGANTPHPAFISPIVGASGQDLTCELVVTDSYGGIGTDTVTIHVLETTAIPIADGNWGDEELSIVVEDGEIQNIIGDFEAGGVCNYQTTVGVDCNFHGVEIVSDGRKFTADYSTGTHACKSSSMHIHGTILSQWKLSGTYSADYRYAKYINTICSGWCGLSADGKWTFYAPDGVPDLSPPEIVLNGQAAISVKRGEVYHDPGATALSELDGILTGDIVVDNPVDTSELGTYDISYNVTDSFGKVATEVKRTVVVLTPQLNAQFWGAPIYGVKPLAVEFTDTSAGEITSWLWDFGDGNTSTDRHPTHIYDQRGVYDVSLTVRGDGASNTETKADFITVRDCEADFSGAPLDGSLPLEVAFTDETEGNVMAWSWDFGDGVGSSAPNPVHKYNSAGIYSVSVTVTGDSGGTDIKRRADYIDVQALGSGWFRAGQKVYWGFFGESICMSGDNAIVGGSGLFLGSAYIFKLRDTGWVEYQKLNPNKPNVAKYDNFGCSVSLSGGNAIVGSSGRDPDHSPGAAFIFKQVGESWLEHQKLFASDGSDDDRFGSSVSLYGDYAIIGASSNDGMGDKSGCAYIFKQEGETWVEHQKLLASNGGAGAYFGCSVFLSGDYAIVGARGFGSAYVFKREGETWVEQQKLDGNGGDWFGYSVFLSGNHAIVGAIYDDENGADSGSAYIFKRESETWVEQQKLLASDGSDDDRFGSSVSLSDEHAIVGAYNKSDGFGAAYLFRREGEMWTTSLRLKPDDNYYQYYGSSVYLGGNFAFVGSPRASISVDQSGAVYSFQIKTDASVPSVVTETIMVTTAHGAESGGNVTADGGGTVTARGVCWSTSANPKTSNSKTTNGTGTGSFTSSITGLTPETEYHVRAYATNSAGTAYGIDRTFTTTASVSLPTVSTTVVTGVTSSIAESGGNITSNGGDTVTARGVCWSTSANPKTSNSKTTNGTGTGSFTSSITGLTPETEYHVRAYATNSAGTAYGIDRTFTTTASVSLPTVSTTVVTGVTSSIAESGGNITSNGGDTVTARGVCWSTSANPKTSNSKTTNGTGTGSFTSSITGLTPETEYHVRAYATNSAGTSYGIDRTFTTSASVSLPTVSTTVVTGVTSSIAESGGNITSDGGGTVTARGVCWSTSANPKTSNSKTTNGTGPGSFTSSITGLNPETEYHVRAYATNSAGTSYGIDRTFTTSASVSLPTVSTTVVTGVTSISAESGGNITSDGGGTVTARGVCWSTSANPKTSNSKTTNGTGPGSFTSSITGLTPETEYHVRAYATNSAGTAYAIDRTFTTTASVSLPTVSTTVVTGVTSSIAESGGNITSNGGDTVTARGVCWSTSANPKTSNSKTTNGTGTGSFTSSITGLTPETEYHVRAYATNSAGTAYAIDRTFTTTESVSLPTVSTTVVTGVTSSIAESGGNITSDGGGTVTARGVCWSTSANPKTSNSKTTNGTGTGSFTSSITGLTPETEYHVRAYATNRAGTAYGIDRTFTTSAAIAFLPTVSTSAITGVTSSIAESGGNVTSDGGDTVTVRGICLSTSVNPTTIDSKTTNGEGTGSFTSRIKGLNSETEYHVRAYATNSKGTAYGDDIVFTTAVALPRTLLLLPDTGQTKCYDNDDEIIPCPASGEAFHGQDATYLINPPSYTKLDADGNDLPDTAASWVMVRDNVTGLIWEVKTDDESVHDKDNEYTWYDSNPVTNGGNAGTPGDGTDTEDFINALNAEGFGGYRDWRLPTFRELQSITNLEKRERPAINVEYFPNAESYYWSSTTISVNTYVAFMAWSGDGGDYFDYKANDYRVRAVRGGQTGTLDPLVLNGDGTVTDVSTGLMWQQAGTESEIAWEAAISHCEGLSLAGYTDWRLPSSRELRSIVDYTTYKPAIDAKYFPSTVSSRYWSSTTHAYDTDDAWGVNFDYGYGESWGYNKSNRHYARAVRGGQARLLGHLVILSPKQASIWYTGEAIEITWDTQGIGENVSISISCQGGKLDTFETIIESTENDGVHSWIVSGLESVNCVLKIELTNDLSKGTIQGLFSIKSAIPTVTTTATTGVTAHSAESGGNVTADGGGSVTARGVCWSKSAEPTVSDGKTTDGTGQGIFTSAITGLEPETEYHIRAYATNSAGTAYGIDRTFTTTASVSLPTVSTTAVTGVTSSIAESGGNITSDGGGTVTARGVCWSTSANPKTSNSKTTNGTGPGSFTSSITGLEPETEYHVRAYATNSAGTAYGIDRTFTTTASVSLPTVSTTAVTGVTSIIAESGGNVTADGGGTVTARGVCWSTSANPKTSNSKTTNGTGPGSFTSSITGLEPETEYHVRAYATNSAGTAYGIDRTFTTTASVSLPTVSTTVVTGVTSIIAESGGNVTADGGGTVTARGVCWSTSVNPKTSNSKTTNGTGPGSFTSSITGLEPETEYHVRAYATNSAGTAYGIDRTFTTSASVSLPTVSTTVVTGVTSIIAESGGNVTADGGGTVTARGVCWSTSVNPKTSNSKTTNGTGPGSFTSSITGLEPETEYHVRAYATNSAGTAYGIDRTFTTSASVSLPTVSTTVVTGVTSISAESGGNVTADGGGTVTARGVCWSTSANPKTSNSKTTNGTGPGSFTSSITGLEPETEYHVRAYATNSAGTAYGIDRTFTTTASVSLPTVSTTVVTGVTSISAESGGNITSDGGGTVTARGVCWSTSANPKTSNSKTTNGTGPGSFTSSITGLTPETEYHVRAYATNSAGTAYGIDRTFTTSESVSPAVSTTAVTGVTSISAESGGNVTAGSDISARGVCWSTSTNPTTADRKTSDGTGTGTFTSAITGLNSGTPYYLRAYAVNSAGTGYGAESVFKTSYSSTLYVITNGQCGQAPCYQTIQLALEAAEAGALIKVADGIYSEALDWKKPGIITISGGWRNSFTEHNGMSEIYNPIATGDGSLKLQPNVKVVHQ